MAVTARLLLLYAAVGGPGAVVRALKSARKPDVAAVDVDVDDGPAARRPAAEVDSEAEFLDWEVSCMEPRESDGFDDEMEGAGPCPPPAGGGEAFRESRNGDEWASGCSHPASDTDSVQGHGNSSCRYEPSKAEHDKFKATPEDIAIVIPINKDWVVSEDEADLGTMLQYSVHLWRKYAKLHGYAFYFGPPAKSELCYGLQYRMVQWVKPCMAMQMLKKHKYVIVADTDTFVAKPLLRLEPLFGQAGLLDDSTGKTIALAGEWGSCLRPGAFDPRRHPMAGRFNSGIYLLKQSPSATKALSALWNLPMKCTPTDKTLLRCRNVVTSPGGGSPHYEHIGPHDLNHAEPCMKLIASLRDWSYEQVAFDLAVVSDPEFKPFVTQWRSGCPINSPWADFITHMVSGSFDKQVYNNFARDQYVPPYHKCLSAVLDKNATAGLYTRCSLCDALPPTVDGFRLSCPGRFVTKPR